MLGLVRDQLAVVAAPKAEGHDAAEIAPPRPLVGLALADTLADAVALGFGKGRSDGQEQFPQAVAGDVSAEVEQMEADAALAQVLDRGERQIEGAPEQAIELWRR